MAESPVPATPTGGPTSGRSPKTMIPIEIKESEMAEIGIGMFIGTKVKAGTVLLCMPQPKLNIIKDGKIDKTCDNCLATEGEDGSKTVNIEDLKLVACEGCNFMHYCSSDCKNAASINHHGAECSILKSILDHYGFDQGSTLLGKELTRGVIRLLSIRAAPNVPESATANFFVLKKPDMATYFQAAEVKKIAAKAADIAEQYELLSPGLSKVDGKEEVINLCFAMSINNVAIVHPKFNVNQLAEYNEVYNHGGFCYDYPTPLNHSCDPDCFIVHNKSELRVIAAKYIPAGKELTFAYDAHDRCVRNFPGYEVQAYWNGQIHPARRHALKTHWGFDCMCIICPGGPMPPMAGSTLLNTLNNLWATPQTPIRNRLAHQEFEDTIAKAVTAGWPKTSYPMRETYQQWVRELSYHDDQYYVAVSECCVLYAIIEPQNQLPSIPLDEHLITLRWLVEIIDMCMCRDRFNDQFEEPDVWWGAYWGLRLKLVRQTAKCFGTRSDVAKYEKAEFRRVLEEEQVDYDELKIKSDYPRAMRLMMDSIGIDVRTISRAWAELKI